MKEMAARMFNLLPPLDVIDPKSFMAETISILLGYPDEVVARTVHEIPRRTDRPTLRLIKSVCDELVEPIDRELQRRRASESHRAELPRPKNARTASSHRCRGGIGAKAARHSRRSERQKRHLGIEGKRGANGI